jgi:hypothetical protein
MRQSEAESVLKMEESESEVLCADSTQPWSKTDFHSL